MSIVTVVRGLFPKELGEPRECLQKVAAMVRRGDKEATYVSGVYAFKRMRLSAASKQFAKAFELGHIFSGYVLAAFGCMIFKDKSNATYWFSRVGRRIADQFKLFSAIYMLSLRESCYEFINAKGFH